MRPSQENVAARPPTPLPIDRAAGPTIGLTTTEYSVTFGGSKDAVGTVLLGTPAGLEALTAFLQKIGLASSEIEIARRVLSEQSHHELPDLKGVPDDPSATRGARHASIGAGAKSPMSDTSDDSIRREVSKLRRVDYRGKVVLFVVSSQS